MRTLRELSSVPNQWSWIFVVMTLGLSVGEAIAQPTPIPQMLRVAQQPLRQFTPSPSGGSPDIETVLSETDLVVMGLLESPRSYLRSDELDVYTDFNVVDIQTIGSRGGRDVGSSPQLTVTFLGGVISIDGLTYTSVHEALPIPGAGTRCLLLLKKERNGYRLAGTYYGAFSIENASLRRLTTTRVGQELDGRPAEDTARSMAHRLR